MKIKYSAAEIATRIAAVDPSFRVPTDEQIPIIQAPLAPTVVIAGAGSGKTEVMSQRVLFLVANSLITPDQLLGLTFTRKSAGELSRRIKIRLRQLKSAKLLPDNLDESELTVSTYHSYAGKVLADHAIRIGIDANSEPIGQAAAWQIAFEEVNRFAGNDLPINGSVKSVVDEVMELSTQLAENDKTTDEIVDYTNILLDQLDSFTDRQTNEVLKFKEELQQRLAILPIVAAFDQRRKQLGLLTFNDHMSIAAKLVEESRVNHNDDIGVIERGKYKVVLLDEYQDTSFNQIKFLSNLFGNNHPVTAVGDPNQAIYGWRSASSETLDTFSQSFNSKATKYTLLTTWRNDKSILELANVMIDEISNKADIKKLSARPNAAIGQVEFGVYETALAEARAIAESFSKEWFAEKRQLLSESEKTTFAVLVRNRSQIDLIQSAFEELDIPTDIPGVGGLIHTPEVADIIALLSTLTMPDTASALMRLLTGAHIALGPRDLMALGGFAKSFARSNEYSRGKQLKQALEENLESNATADEFASGSIIEALEQLLILNPNEFEKYQVTPRFSEIGLMRLREFATSLRTLRKKLTGSITDAIYEAEQFLSLNTEVLVRDGWQSGRRNLDRFLDEAARFERNGGTLISFLHWLKVAEEAEGGLKPSEIDVRSDAVQILTIHAAKGAEWDFVAIPGLADKSFPSTGKRSDNWLSNAGCIPVTLRGDCDQLPSINFDNFTTNKSLKAGLEKFTDNWKDRKLHEEYRLAYVAITRAKQGLLCTTSHFRSGEQPVDPSRLFELFIKASSKITGAKIINQSDIPLGINPEKENPKTFIWPQSDEKLSKVKKIAQICNNAKPIDIEQQLLTDISAERRSILLDMKAVINEANNRQEQLTVVLPTRVSVSTLLYLAKEPAELALRIRRPMPNHIDKYARQGTEFHLWLEHYFQHPALISVDELFYQNSLNTQADAPLERLQSAWLASEWANIIPEEIEFGFETMIDSTLIRGRIDAVYKVGNDRYEVVDWKTGKVKSGDDLEIAAIQLAMYRLAYAKLKSIPVENISAAFHYVVDSQTIRPSDILNEDQLKELIGKVPIEN